MAGRAGPRPHRRNFRGVRCALWTTRGPRRVPHRLPPAGTRGRANTGARRCLVTCAGPSTRRLNVGRWCQAPGGGCRRTPGEPRWVAARPADGAPWLPACGQQRRAGARHYGGGLSGLDGGAAVPTAPPNAARLRPRLTVEPSRPLPCSRAVGAPGNCRVSQVGIHQPRFCSAAF